MKTIFAILTMIFILSACASTNDKSDTGTKGNVDLSDVRAVDQKDIPELDVDAGNIKQGKKYTFEYQFSGDVDIFPELKSFLDALAEYQLENIGMGVRITGHSDNTGTFDQNQSRAAQRAKNISDYLLAKGIQISRIYYTSRGAMSPIASNETDTGRRKNRRIEIEVFAK